MNTDKFREHVTGASFALTLSKRMIEMLCQMDAQGCTWGLWSTAHSLVDRGLCEWTPGIDVPEGKEVHFRKYVLTDAGRAVLPLLKLAGLYVDFPPLDPPVHLSPPAVTPKERA